MTMARQESLMPIPPKGDPQRPIELAIGSTRLLGIVSTLFGLVMVLVFGYFNRYQRFRPHFIALGLVVWFVPGVLYLAASHLMRGRRRGGVVTAMATAAGQGVFAAALFVGTLTVQPVSPVPVVLTALWVAALVQLLGHLRRSFESVRLDTQHVRGFEALGAPAPKPVLPLDGPPPQEAGRGMTAGDA
jgi:hypothetical protein